MVTAIPNNPVPATVAAILTRISDSDSDYRFMALSDLLRVFVIAKNDFMHHDYNIASRTSEAVVRLLDDANGEVQNQALKCLGPLVQKLPAQLVNSVVDRLSTLELKNAIDNSIPSMALRAVVGYMPRPVPGVVATRDVVESYSSISRILIPRIAGPSGMLESDVGLTPDTVDVLIEIVRCFGPMLQPIEVENLQTALVKLLERDKGSSVIKKRAVVAMSMLAHYFSEDLLRHFISRAASLLGQPHLPPVTRRLYITIIGSIARSIPYRFGAYLPKLVPFILDCLGEEELQSQLEEISESTEASLVFNEVREAALVALEAFLASCPNQMRPFTADAIDASLRYLKFDPNYAMDDDDEMDDDDDDDEEPDEDDEYEADGGFDDDDDASWKVRRCAAKTLYTIVSTRSSGDLLESGVLYGKVAPALIKRFDEREENVRLEVISTMALLVRKTGEGVVPEFSIDDSQSELPNQPPHSRKRRRQSSGGGASAFALTLGLSSLSGTGLTSPTTEKIPASGPQADLAGLTPTIIKSSVKLLKGKLIPTKQATINLLDDLVTVQRGGLGPYFDQIIAPIIDAIKSPGTTSASTSLSVAGGSASATAATLKISALHLTSDIVKNHSSAMLQPHLPSIVAGVVSVTHDRFYKISGGAIQTAEEVVKAITPPRSRLTAQKFKGELQKLYDVIIDRTIANDADVEVRQKAIHALGTLLARTSGPEGAGLLPEDKQKAALGHLLERLKNETTRLAAVRAVDNIAALSSSTGVQFNAAWIREVAVELSAQLRKANRALRGSSIMALKHLILSPATKGTLDDATVKSIVSDLILVIPNNDAQLLGPGLLVLAHLAQEKPKIVITNGLIQALCTLLQSTVPGSVLDSLVVLVTDIGQVGCGKELMKGLLMDVGVGGEPSVVGKVIGTLLVASGDSAGVSINSFVEEVKTNSEDQARASLGLAVLGEAGLRLGPKSSLKPALFLQQLSHRSDKVALSAAVALGRAGAGNVAEYVPTILSAMNSGASQYLLLQSIKEVLQQAALALTDLKEFSTPIWDRVVAASAVEDNKAVCAECIGRMVLIDPKTNMPKLEALMKEENPGLRVIAVQALRYTLPEDSEVFDDILKGSLVDMLKTTLQDPDLEIRRHALSTFNSASHNKPELVLGHCNELIPHVMKETNIRPELVREVQMGPFKHIIDDGLEVRKAAYETLYALMQTAFSRISIIDLYDRIVAGLSDDMDIRLLCNLMVSKLVHLVPDETSRRLDSFAEAFRATLSHKLKDTAVKQEIEKQDEAKKSVLRLTLLLGEKLKPAVNGTGGANPSAQGNQKWSGYWDWVNKDFQNHIKSIRDEGKEEATA